MRDYKVLLYDHDHTLVQALAHYMNRNPEIPIMIYGFTKFEQALETLREEAFDLCLLDRKCIEKTELINAPILWIYDETAGKDGIGRYSTAKQYVEAIYCVLTGSESRSDRGEESPVREVYSCSYLACYSPCGRSGVTTLARQLCLKLALDAKTGGDVIYLGFEEFAEETDPALKMEDLLYRLKSGTSDIGEYLTRNTELKNGYRMIKSAGCYTDLRELNREDLLKLKDVAADAGFGAVVFDIGAASLADPEMLTVFDRIYLPRPTDPHMEAKYRQFQLEFARRGLLSDLKAKLTLTDIRWE